MRSFSQGVQALRQALADRRCLLVVDDIWSVAAARAFSVTGPHGRVLFTARDPAVLSPVGAQIQQVDVLDEPAARSLLAQVSGTPVEQHPEQLRRVLTGTGRVALALALVGAADRAGRRWSQVADELDAGRHIYGDHPYADTFKALQLATAALDPPLLTAYLGLAVYPADTAVPIVAMHPLWARLHGYTLAQTRAVLDELEQRRLLIVDGETVGLHDLQHDLLLLRAVNRSCRGCPGPRGS